MNDLLTNLPDVIVIGDIEMLFLGAAAALGMPKMARKILERRYGASSESSTGAEKPDGKSD